MNLQELKELLERHKKRKMVWVTVSIEDFEELLKGYKQDTSQPDTTYYTEYMGLQVFWIGKS